MIGLDQRRGLHALAFAFAAASVLAAQIVRSRLFSATVGYDYAFILVSLAMLGLGAGGLIVQRAPEFFRAGRMGVQASVLGMMMAVSGVAGVTTMVRLYPRLAPRSRSPRRDWDRMKSVPAWTRVETTERKWMSLTS